jgi:hypothetical protein
MKQLTANESTLISGGIRVVHTSLPVFTTSATILPDGTIVIYCGQPGTPPPSSPSGA